MKYTAALAVVIVAGLSGAAFAEPSVEILDQAGAILEVDQPVERIASVYGLGTYYLYALGVSDRLVGAGYVGVKSVAQASETMRRLEPRLEELFLFGDPNVEEILRRDPQLVLADGSRHAAFSAQMNDLGIPTIQYLVESSDALLEAMRMTGLALGPDALDRAEAFVREFERIRTTIAEAVARLDEADCVRVLFLGTAPLQAATGEMFQTELIEAAGGRSVSAGLIGYWSEVNLEQILLWNPDVIVIPPYGPVQPADLLEDPDWASIGAVQVGRVHRMPRLMAPMDTPVPESLLGILWLSSVFYPDLVSLDLRAEADRFYERFYGLTLTEQELDRLTAR